MKHVQPDFRALAPLETADLHTPLPLRPLFDLVQGALHKADHGDAKLVILDDIATLEWIGFSLLDVSRFARALWGACLKVRRLPTRYFRLIHPNGRCIGQSDSDHPPSRRYVW
jgi:hypothetical protein